MNIGGIDSSRIEAMMAQLKAAAQKPAAPALGAGGGMPGIDGLKGGLGIGGVGGADAPDASTKVSFSDALKGALQNVSDAQNTADDMGKRFAAGDDSVSLSDTMIAMQKANISFQATLQVRNKLVSAYHDIMNMQV
ncbi:flagellar hook-basal body complex protein FliE [Massilia sp. 9096]|uniref:flagellar hook-basal body complex protein FliE n=1 Tax=Massilia sp. 9096 TaxID=1500894 RepID=UPI000559E18A|nr:flagellar hook-basal body complex protein FliE [Massilia sp. 9096]